MKIINYKPTPIERLKGIGVSLRVKKKLEKDLKKVKASKELKDQVLKDWQEVSKSFTKL